MTVTKKTLQEQVEKLKQENEQFRFCLQYTLFDVEATRRERDGVKAEVVLLREELADLRQGLEQLEDRGLIE